MRKVVSVAFQSGPKLYDYFTDFPLEPGDTVVVPAGDWYSVGTVKRVKDSSIRAEKYVVQYIDIKKYRERMAELMFE